MDGIEHSHDAPLLEQVVKVKPGDKYTLVDAKDMSISIDGLDDDKLIELANAVDMFFTMKQIGDQQAVEAATRRLHAAWQSMPIRVKLLLESNIKEIVLVSEGERV